MRLTQLLKEAFIDSQGKLQDFTLGGGNDVANDIKNIAQNLGNHPGIIKKYGNERIIRGSHIYTIMMYLVDKFASMDELPNEEDFTADDIRDNLRMYFEEDGIKHGDWTPEEAYEIILFSLGMLGMQDIWKIDPKKILNLIIAKSK